MSPYCVYCSKKNVVHQKQKKKTNQLYIGIIILITLDNCLLTSNTKVLLTKILLTCKLQEGLAPEKHEMRPRGHIAHWKPISYHKQASGSTSILLKKKVWPFIYITQWYVVPNLHGWNWSKVLRNNKWFFKYHWHIFTILQLFPLEIKTKLK